MINIKKANVKRQNIDYESKSVRRLIRCEFLKKCYICESYPNQNYEIDHFYPKKIYSHLTNNYSNLFFSCGKCNKLRPRKYINNSSENEVLNNIIDNVEELILLDVNLDKCKKAIVIKAKNVNDTYLNKKIDNTIKLLEKIYNGKGTDSEAYRCLRDDIVEKIMEFKNLLVTFYEDYKNTRFEKRFKNKIVNFLSRESEYTMFKRTIVLKDSEYKKDFIQYFD